MDMETNSHYYSSERLVLDHFDLLELLRVHNAREGQIRQAAMGVVFLPFNDGKVTLNRRRIQEHCRQSTAQLTQLHEAPLQVVPRLVKEHIIVVLVEGSLHIRLMRVDNEQFMVFALHLINQVRTPMFG
jgi:hypothetical protein